MVSPGILESQQSVQAPLAGRTAAGCWKLTAGTALSLRPRQRGVLEVAQGRVWLTAGGSADHVLLAGFSQGGAIILSAGLKRSEPVAGLVALSTYLPEVDAAPAQLVDGAIAQPIFMAHGSADPVIPLQVAEHSAQVLTSLGFGVEWHRYAMAHQVCGEEIQALGDWLQARFAQA